MIGNIPERPFPRQATPPEEANNLYLAQLGDKRTARHASEEGKQSPEPHSVNEATKYIRIDLQPIFKRAAETEAPQEKTLTLTELKTVYWSRAAQVGPEHGAKPNFTLEDYLHVGLDRDYLSIKELIENDYPPDSIPRSVLDGIDAYHQVLNLNPATAATITMELIGRSTSHIKSDADAIMTEEQLPASEATSRAIANFITSQVPEHISTITTTYGTGENSIRPYMNKQSFYPRPTFEEDSVLTLSYTDVEGLVEVYNIQSRPYSDEELSMADELAQNPAMQTAMIRTQEALVAASEDYLKQHPDRARGNLKNFSEIFAPDRSNGDLQLLPNPKLLRAMVNNVLPAVAQSLRDREATVRDVTAADITRGVHIASKEYKLFQTNIGQFKNYNPESETAELHSIYKVVCPANSLFPTYLSMHLAEYYEKASQQLTE